MKTGGAMHRALDMVDATYREVERNPDSFVSCTTAAEIRQAKKRNKI